MRRLFTAVAAVLAVATAVGLVLLWPGDVQAPLGGGIAVTSERAKALEVEETICSGFGGRRCQIGRASCRERV